MVDIWAPKKSGYAFDGYYSADNKLYYKMALLNDQQTADIEMLDEAFVEKIVPASDVVWSQRQNLVIYGRWENQPFECDDTYWCFCGTDFLKGATAHFVHGNSVISPASIKGYKFDHFEYLGVSYSSGQSIPVQLYRGTSVEKDEKGNYLRDSEGNLISHIHMREMVHAYYTKDSCVTAGTLITLANGVQVPVENLTGSEMLLVWSLQTGQFDYAPILFVDSDPLQEYKVINLTFSDGTVVKVVSEHAFWNYTLNEYVYLREDAAKYIGHSFNKQGVDVSGNLTSYSVQLTKVTITQEYTTVYSPVTYGHLCYYVNGMLSMPGGIEGLFNIFEVDEETMTIDAESMAQDIVQYGLFTYEEFAELLPVTEDMFNAVSGQYLKVAIGKGLITIETLQSLISRYAVFFD